MVGPPLRQPRCSICSIARILLTASNSFWPKDFGGGTAPPPAADQGVPTAAVVPGVADAVGCSRRWAESRLLTGAEKADYTQANGQSPPTVGALKNCRWLRLPHAQPQLPSQVGILNPTVDNFCACLRHHAPRLTIPGDGRVWKNQLQLPRPRGRRVYQGSPTSRAIGRPTPGSWNLTFSRNIESRAGGFPGAPRRKGHRLATVCRKSQLPGPRRLVGAAPRGRSHWPGAPRRWRPAEQNA